MRGRRREEERRRKEMEREEEKKCNERRTSARTRASSIFTYPRARAMYAYAWIEKFHPKPKT